MWWTFCKMQLTFSDDENPVYVVIFFFQAEDGIRDIGVTGVQTCALPISSAPPGTRGAVNRTSPPWTETTSGCPMRARRRSEERRVGKEGRSGRAPAHAEKR